MAAEMTLRVAAVLVSLDRTVDQIARLVAKGRDAVEDDEFLTLAAAQLGLHLGYDVADLPKEWRTEHPDVPWHLIIGFRNRLAHDYHKVDFYIVWDTLVRDVSALRRALAAEIEAAHEMVAKEPDPGSLASE